MIVAVGYSWVAAYIYEARMPEPAELGFFGGAGPAISDGFKDKYGGLGGGVGSADAVGQGGNTGTGTGTGSDEDVAGEVDGSCGANESVEA
ncbi:hypothetical protein V498_06963 [Pseudogymnoascus sp. VKM F-4517 (FW-2822)]|nr:hypothetical protein V498_06963 [Pseudogymnoascus sp. VKM F-4517 (FW-2822)]